MNNTFSSKYLNLNLDILQRNVGGRRLRSRPTLNPEKPNQDDISKSNLIESVLATIGDVHKFDDLGLNKS